MTHRNPLRRAPLIALIGFALVASGATSATAVTAVANPGPASSTPVAFPFEAALRSYISTRRGNVTVAVRDLATDTTMVYTQGSGRNVTASIVKVQIMAAVMLRAQDAGRALTSSEKSLISPMIRYSDNDAATALFNLIGKGPGLAKAAARLGMTHTVSDPANHWGLTSTDAVDQTTVMRHFAVDTGALSATNRAYGLSLMRAIASDQDWGVTAGPPTGSVALKNGWLPRVDGWHVNSIGFVDSGGSAYTIGVLTSDDPGAFSSQVSTIEEVSKIVWAHRDEFVTPVPTSRYAGFDRYGTAVAISRAAFPRPFAAGSGSVYLARSDLFADALAAGTLTDGPILLVPQCSGVPAVVAAEIERLAPDRVVALGGDSAICPDTLSLAAGGRAEARLAGPDRSATARAIADERVRQAAFTEVYLASGADDSPDALAGGELTQGPILTLGTPQSIVAAARWVTNHRGVTRVVALGGEQAVPADALASVAGGLATHRLAGADRFETAAAIGAYAFTDGGRTAYLARADVFADAVAAGPLTQGPVLLVRPCGLPGATSAALSTARPDRIVALGGPAAICDEVLAAAAKAAA